MLLSFEIIQQISSFSLSVSTTLFLKKETSFKNSLPKLTSKMTLDGKSAVVIGGAGGIGVEICKHLLMNGLSVS